MKSRTRLTKAERRSKRRRPKMKVSGASVKTIARLLRERARHATVVGGSE